MEQEKFRKCPDLPFEFFGVLIAMQRWVLRDEKNAVNADSFQFSKR